MKTFNITAQVYDKQDNYKQTILINDVITANSKESAITEFYDSLLTYNILKIYSVEEISQVAS
jgi:hypothetical protein